MELTYVFTIDAIPESNKGPLRLTVCQTRRIRACFGILRILAHRCRRGTGPRSVALIVNRQSWTAESIVKKRSIVELNPIPASVSWYNVTRIVRMSHTPLNKAYRSLHRWRLACNRAIGWKIIPHVMEIIDSVRLLVSQGLVPGLCLFDITFVWLRTAW